MLCLMAPGTGCASHYILLAGYVQWLLLGHTQKYLLNRKALRKAMEQSCRISRGTFQRSLKIRRLSLEKPGVCLPLIYAVHGILLAELTSLVCCFLCCQCMFSAQGHWSIKGRPSCSPALGGNVALSPPVLLSPGSSVFPCRWRTCLLATRCCCSFSSL